MSRAPTEGEFADWLGHPVTKRLREVLEKKRDTLRHEWEGGTSTSYSKDEFVFANMMDIGTCRGYAFVCDLELDQLAEEDDGKQQRVGTEGSGSLN